MRMTSEIILVLENIRSAHNVGQLFRTSDGAGVDRILLCGYTPTPLDRFGRIDQKMAKTSLGATESVPWEHVRKEALPARLSEYANAGFSIVAIEQTPRSVSLYDFEVPKKVVYVLGNEIDGVDPQTLALADMAIEIPMHGMKESLNVGVAGGIVLFHR